MSKRELRSAGSTTAQTLDSTKNYKLNSAGTLVESTGTPAGTEIVFSGSKSSLRRIADLERNVSILAAKALTEDGEGSGYSGSVDYSKTAGKWVQARTLSLTGDVTGSATIDGSGNVSLSTTVASNTVALGTDTTGNYMVNVSAGTGISVSHTQGEGSTATVSLNATTDNVSEGSTNLYHTTARARGAISVTDNGGDGSLSYNSTTGVITYTGPSSSEVRAHLSAGTGIGYSSGVISNTDLGSSQNIFKNFTDGTTTAAADSNNDTFKFRGSAGVTVAVASDDATHGDSLLVSLSAVPNSSLANSSITVAGTSVSLGGSVSISTSNVSEGSNLYYTDARARAAITGGTGVTVSTGVVSIGQPVGTGSSVQFNAIGIGTAAGATAGTIRATNEITAYYSDKRLKENIKPIENALAKTLQLHGVTYNANDVAASFGYTNKEAQVGLLAQDVKAVLPEVVVPAPFDLVVRDGKEVSKSGQDFMTVKYEKIVALLVEAIKELNDKVESLEAQLGGSKSL